VYAPRVPTCFRCPEPATVALPEGGYCHDHARALADSLARAVVLDRDDNVCQACGDKRSGCQWAHILARRVAPALVHEPDNALALCASCHGDFTLHPARFEAWLDRERPGLRERLRRDQGAAERSPLRVTLDVRIASLRSMLYGAEVPA
jgi:hypothetical protein